MASIATFNISRFEKFICYNNTAQNDNANYPCGNDGH